MKQMKILPLFFLLLVIACGQKKTKFKQQLSSENLVRLDMKSLSISVLVPKEHAVFENKGKISINLNPNGKAVKQFSIETLKSTIANVEFKESLVFENGTKLKYKTFNEEGGSGGTEYHLEGVFEIADKTFQIVSSIQDDGKEQGNAEFCMRYLSTVVYHKFTR